MNNFVKLPECVTFLILKDLTTKDLIMFKRTCKYFYELFNYNLKFLSIDLRETKISNDNLKYLKSVHSINLSDCKQITDNGLRHLKGVHTIDLYNCQQITDNGLQHLRKYNPDTIIYQ